MKTKKTTRRSPSPKTRDMSVREMADFIVLNVPEINEAFTRADIELALDDRGWTNLGERTQTGDLSEPDRLSYMKKARLYWLRDPLAKQAVRLWTDYALGNGISYKADDESTQQTLDKFFHSRRNLKLLNSEGQRKSSKKLLVDGEVFFAVFDNEIIRYVPPEQITDVISDPDDEEHVLAYRRQTATNKVMYYADWASDEEDRALAEQQTDPKTKGKITLEPNVVVRHVAFDTLGRRGNSLLIAAIDWSKEHRRFMEARVAILQALAKFAYKTTVKGGQGAVTAIQKRLQSSFTSTGPTEPERNPVTAPGSNWIQNNGLDLTPMPRVTGAVDAEADSNQLKLMVSAATGIMLHYFGDPSTGNLATAEAMELPMLKMFESYQQLWIDVYRDLFSIILEEDIDAEERENIDIDLPPILKEDITKLGGYLAQLTAAFPEAKVPDVLQMALQALGINNLDEIMKKIEEKRKELDAKAEDIANRTLEAVKSAGNGKQPAAAGQSALPQQQSTQQEETFREMSTYLGKLCAILEVAGELSAHDHPAA